MEPFVKSLYDRLDENKKMQLFCIEENAINEMHNNGIISKVDPTGTSKLHDSDPKRKGTDIHTQILHSFHDCRLV